MKNSAIYLGAKIGALDRPDDVAGGGGERDKFTERDVSVCLFASAAGAASAGGILSASSRPFDSCTSSPSTSLTVLPAWPTKGSSSVLPLSFQRLCECEVGSDLCRSRALNGLNARSTVFPPSSFQSFQSAPLNPPPTTNTSTISVPFLPARHCRALFKVE
jgi:hypothetical protein